MSEAIHCCREFIDSRISITKATGNRLGTTAIHSLLIVLTLCIATLAPCAALAVSPYTFTTLNDPAASNGTNAEDISNNGLVLGAYGHYGPDGEARQGGFIYSNSSFTNFEYPYPETSCDGDALTEPGGINNNGQVVGWATWYPDNTCVGATSGFIYENGSFTNFNESGSGFTAPEKVNDEGVIVGTACTTDSSNICHGFVWANGSFTDYSYPGSSDTGFIWINNLGQIIGSYNTGGTGGTFLYENGAVTPIAGIPSGCYGESINDYGQIFVFCEDDTSYVLQNNILSPITLPTNYDPAFSLNNSAQLPGTITSNDTGFLATPSDPQSAKQLGCPGDTPGGSGCGDPISIATGNVYQQANDYQTSGQNQLRFDRYYNSRAVPTFAVSLGMNWRSTYDRYIRILSTTSVLVERSDGQQVSFTYNGSAWTTDTDVDFHLTNSGTTWTLTDSNDTVETYSTLSSGLEAVLNTIVTRNGYTQTLHYNGSNQLTSVSDTYSRSLGFTYSSGLIQTVTTPDSLVLTYGYTTISQGTQLTSVSYNTSPVTNITYNYGENSAPFSALTSLYDEKGNKYGTWTYDALSRGLTSQLGVGANLTTVAYNANGTTTVTNAFGVRDTYTFTTLQNVSKITQISRAATSTTAAATRTFGYDANGYLNSSTDWDGNLTTYTNDSRGQVTVLNEAVGSPVARTTNTTYDSTTPNTTYPYHLPTVIVTPELTTNFNYDSSGNLLTKVLTDTTTQTVPYSTNGQTRTWTYTWLNSLLHSVQTPRTDVTNKTTFSYDASGALVQISNALAQKTKITSHTGGGLPLTVVNPSNVTTLLTYDPRNYLLTSTLVATGGNLITTYGYDKAENLTSVTLPDNSELTNGYDTAHRLTSVTDLFGNDIQYTLDALGDRTLIVTYDPTGTEQRQHSGVFDALGRVTQDIGGENQITKYSYDPQSNVTKITDPLTHITTQTFDALNRLSTVVDPTPGGTTTTTYDPHDRPLTVQAPNGATTSYVYDGFGDAIQQASPDSGTSVYHFDPDSNLTQKVDAASATTNSTYDALDRVLTTAYPSDSAENVAYTYDQTPGHGYSIGLLTSVTDAAGSLSRIYNQRSDISTETRTITGSSALTTSYGYDAANRIATITYPSGTVLTNIRDIMGRITSVTSKAPGATSAVNVATGITYEPFGPLTGMTFGNAVAESRAYDLDYRVDNVTDTGTSATLQNLTYVYDAANNVKTITDGVTPANNQTLGYDTHNRLNSAVGNYGSLGYSYDTSSNRLYETVAPTTMYTYAPNSNLLATVKTGGVTQTIGTTAAGNINSFSPANAAGITALTYNQANRLATASAGSSQVAAYTYDAFGHRLIKTTSSAQLFQYDQSGHLIESLSGAGAAQEDHLYLSDMPLATLIPSSGALYYIHNESLGTPQLATSSTQASVWATTYQPFGTTGTVTGTLPQNIRLPGQYNDAETGFYQNGFRDYVPGWGRYLESDPIGLAGGANTFGYAYQNPGKYTDRAGTGPVSSVVRSVLECAGNPMCRAAAIAAGAAICQGARQAATATENAINSILNNDEAPNPNPAPPPSAANSPDVNDEDTTDDPVLPDDATVCRGGECTEERFINGSGVTIDSNGNLQGVSVNAGTGTVEDTAPQGYGQVGTTTVGDVRAAGGDVVPSPTSGNPNHATLGGITPAQAQGLFTPTIRNPNK